MCRQIASHGTSLPAGLPRSGNPAGIVFTHTPKNQVFCTAGATRYTVPIQVRLCRTDGHVSALGCAKFHIIAPGGWECGPKNIKNFHFFVKSRPVGATPLIDFENFYGLLYG